jgi:predicted ATPase/DNA-binding XRE family transcriptional regulator
MDDSFASMLRRHRRAAHLSQEALAEKAALSKDAVSALERGTRRAPYRDTVELLAQALGLDEACYRAFEAAASQARRRSASPGNGTHPMSLPSMATTLVGRDAAIAEILEMLAQDRIVTIVGPGGIGKTRVAVEVAEQFAHGHGRGAWFADLAAVTQRGNVVTKVASAVGVGIADSDNALAELAAALQPRSGILVLDNCEHLIDECAKVAAALAGAAPKLKILATSRERLAVRGENVYQLSALSKEAARVLFTLRASSAGFRPARIEDNAEAVRDICAEVDNIPLAIELAAARARLLGLPELRARLRGQLAVLSGGDRDAPVRQHAMRETIGWSYNLLEEPERALFRRLAVFAGGWGIDALEPQELGAFASLLEKSLVTVDLETDPVRYRLLEPIRAFAMERLRAAGELDASLEWHARWMADFADQAQSEADTYKPSAVKTAVRELDNARAALEWSLGPGGEIVVGARVLAGMRTGWLTTGLGAECRQWCASILERLDEDAYPMLAAKVYRASIAHMVADDRLDLIERAIAASERAGDWNGVALLTSRLAARYGERGRFEDAERAFERVASIRETRRLEPNADWISVLVHRSHFLSRQNRLDEAAAAIDESIALARELQRPYHEMWSLLNAAEIAFARQDPHEAVRIAGEGLALSVTHEHVVAEVCARTLRSGYYLAAGDAEAARSEARAAISGGFNVEARIISSAILHLAAAAAMAGDSIVAARLKGYVDRHHLPGETPLEPSEINSYDILTSTLQAQFSPDELAELTRQGALLTDSEAAELAGGVTPALS